MGRTGGPEEPAVEWLLERWSAGDAEAVRRVVPLMYDELRRTARRLLASERAGHSLQPTELVHEVYDRLLGRDRPRWRGREHFIAVAALLMRRLLVDHARRRGAARRGGGAVKVTLDPRLAAPASATPELEALDAALTELAEEDRRAAAVVELRFFGGLTNAECAAVLGLSSATVGRLWRFARAWLHDRLSAG